MKMTFPVGMLLPLGVLLTAGCNEAGIDSNGGVQIAERHLLIDVAGDDSFVILADRVTTLSNGAAAMGLSAQQADSTPIRLSEHAFGPFLCEFNDVFVFGDDPEVDSTGDVLATWKVWRRGWSEPRVLSRD